MDVCAHIVVKGMVQGVGFRYFVQQHAGRLGLFGSVRNLYDGNVDIHIEGNRSLIEEFIDQIKIGPRSARVNDLIIEWKIPSGGFMRFDII